MDSNPATDPDLTGPEPSSTAMEPVYAVGRIGVDFGSEARRDGFRLRMDTAPGAPPPDPEDPRQLHDHLVRTPWASNKLIWTLAVDSTGNTPVYALEAEPTVGLEWPGAELLAQALTHPTNAPDLLRRIAAAPPVHPVHRALHDALLGRSLPARDPDRVTRLSVPGRLTGRSAWLFSGQVVPVVEVSTVGLARWTEARLTAAALDVVERAAVEGGALDRERAGEHVRALLDKVYLHFRNPGRSAAERALNHAGTLAFCSGDRLGEALLPGGPVPDGSGERLCTLDSITVARTPYCRAGSDCQDVMVRFLDPAEGRRTAVTYVYTFDVGDDLPVSLAPVHRFLG
ncbi:hypothetical protein ACFP3U_32710 [Kitasatospora misakiensis]|uniref:PatG C-terminal domain-containing protein n=1 Tax=Kitasatospora misakiensis TaxID=67330 RepID=A0ABW0XD38_9ACTN